MAAIKSRNTKPEVYVRKLLFSQGYRYRIAPTNIPGHPDAWLAKYNTALFIHGCFWHRHQGCRYCYTPRSRTEYWMRKFAGNIERDLMVQKKLKESGIRQLIVWECTVRRMVRNVEYQSRMIILIRMFLKGEEAFLNL